MSLRYVITTHRRLAGVGLSKLGHWGNIRHPDDWAAEQAARADARGVPLSIERESK